MLNVLLVGWRSMLSRSTEANEFERHAAYSMDKDCPIAVLLDTLYQVRDQYTTVPDHLVRLIVIAEMVYDEF